MGKEHHGVIRQTRTYARNIALYPYVCLHVFVYFIFLSSVRSPKNNNDDNGNDADLKVELLYKYIFDEDEIIIPLQQKIDQSSLFNALLYSTYI